ncbi:MAG: IS1595 family transposase [Bacteroidetes bacterium]|nr:IS1595 family transposase [Bacteroidota bacterium]
MENRNENTPLTLQKAVEYFSDSDRALEYMITMRWPDGVTCYHCGGKSHVFISTRKIWRCKSCRKQFSLKRGTIMECSPLSFDKWVITFWALANCKNGISSYELARAIGVCQKTAWFLLHRTRHIMATQDFDVKLDGVTEADEHYHGGLEANKHESRKNKAGRGGVGKVIVVGVMKRGGEVRVKIVPDTSKATIHEFIRENVQEGSEIYTDEHASYRGLEEKYIHDSVNHSAHEYVRNQFIHCNGMENFWSLMARIFSGTYISCDAPHLHRYLAEQVMRFDFRKSTDADRFEHVVSRVANQRLTFKALLAENKAGV